jgi:hypothetical protein
VIPFFEEILNKDLVLHHNYLSFDEYLKISNILFEKIRKRKLPARLDIISDQRSECESTISRASL